MVEVGGGWGAWGWGLGKDGGNQYRSKPCGEAVMFVRARKVSTMFAIYIDILMAITLIPTHIEQGAMLRVKLEDTSKPGR